MEWRVFCYPVYYADIRVFIQIFTKAPLATARAQCCLSACSSVCLIINLMLLFWVRFGHIILFITRTFYLVRIFTTSYQLTLKKKKVGGVGIFVKDCYCVHELDSFSISSTESCKVENLWLEITRFGNIVIYGGIYRHPNHNIPDFASKFEDELNKISSRRIPCVVAGDFNIDLLKFDNHTATH